MQHLTECAEPNSSALFIALHYIVSSACRLVLSLHLNYNKCLGMRNSSVHNSAISRHHCLEKKLNSFYTKGKYHFIATSGDIMLRISVTATEKVWTFPFLFPSPHRHLHMPLLLLHWLMGFETRVWIATAVRKAEYKTQIRAHLIEWSGKNSTTLPSFSSEGWMQFCNIVIEMDLFDLGCRWLCWWEP